MREREKATERLRTNMTRSGEAAQEGSFGEPLLSRLEAASASWPWRASRAGRRRGSEEASDAGAKPSRNPSATFVAQRRRSSRGRRRSLIRSGRRPGRAGGGRSLGEPVVRRPVLEPAPREAPHPEEDAGEGGEETVPLSSGLRTRNVSFAVVSSTRAPAMRSQAPTKTAEPTPTVATLETAPRAGSS